VQIILESVLLRREKSMKDRDGQPIVPLPPKNIIEERLDFTDAEREIYNRIYKDARSQFLGYKAEGNVMKNVTAIFAVLMRLRQAVLHPALVLNSINNRAQTEGGAMTPEDRSIKTLIVKYCAGQSQSAKADDVKEEDILKDLGVEPEEEALCLWCNSVRAELLPWLL
jgi:DNA repair protein RAD5